MRGTVNEDEVLQAIRSKAFVEDVFELSMMETVDTPWLACSPNGVGLIDLERLSSL